MRKPLKLAILILLFAFALVAKDREFTMPKAFHAKTYPARDVHDDEKVSIAADPYDLPDKADPVFTSQYLKRGMMPIQVVFSNDGDSSVALNDISVTLIARDRTKIFPANKDDLYRRLSQAVDPISGPNPVDIPLPKKKKKGISQETAREVDAIISAKPRVVEAKATQAAIYIFDIDGIDHPLAGAKLVISGLRRDGHELFYFEIPMEKYLTYQPTSQVQ
jgi:hypothetical protein